MFARFRLPSVLILGLAALQAAADKPDKESKKFLEEVAPILLPEERQIYTDQLNGRGERAEFEKIFWARRDPNLETPENEYQAQYARQRADVDKRFKVMGKIGSQTDCGRVAILLGEPSEVQKEPSSEASFRQPETWTYKDREGMHFQGGQAKISLTGECALANPAASRELDRLASALILNPNLTYKDTKGKPTKLVDLLPKPSPAQTLLKTPRQDFPVETQGHFLKVEGGGSSMLGLVKASAEAFTLEDGGGKRVARLTVVAQAVNSEGRAVAFAERAVLAPVGADGSVLASYRMVVKPGVYELKAGLVDDKSGKASLATTGSVTVPDFNSGGLSVASLLIVADIVEAPSIEATDPDGAYVLGQMKLLTRFGPTFQTTEQPLFVYQAYDGKVDEATGKPNVSVGLTLSKAGQVVATAPEQNFDTPIVGGAIGPVPLAGYAPGSYVAKLTVRDKVAKQEVVVESKLEIR